QISCPEKSTKQNRPKSTASSKPTNKFGQQIPPPQARQTHNGGRVAGVRRVSLRHPFTLPRARSPHPFGCHEARRTRTHTEPPTTSPVAQTLPRRRPQNRPPPRAALHVYSPARRTHAVVAQRSRTRSSLSAHARNRRSALTLAVVAQRSRTLVVAQRSRTRSSHSAPRMQSSHSVRAGRRPPARPSQRAEKRRAIRAPHRKSPRPETRRTQRRECLAPRRPLPSAHRAGRRPAFGQPVARSEARTTASPRRLTRGAPVHDLAFTRFSPALGQLEHGAELRVAADVPDAFVEPVVMQRKAPPDC